MNLISSNFVDLHFRPPPGRLEFLLEAQQAYADYMYLNTPGVLAITAGLDELDPNLLHDFQVFSSFQVFRDHADMENPIIRKLLFDWINFDNYDASTPFYGEVWVEEEHIEEARMMTQEIGEAWGSWHWAHGIPTSGMTRAQAPPGDSQSPDPSPGASPM